MKVMFRVFSKVMCSREAATKTQGPHTEGRIEDAPKPLPPNKSIATNEINPRSTIEIIPYFWVWSVSHHRALVPFSLWGDKGLWSWRKCSLPSYHIIPTVDVINWATLCPPPGAHPRSWIRIYDPYTNFKGGGKLPVYFFPRSPSRRFSNVFDGSFSLN